MGRESRHSRLSEKLVRKIASWWIIRVLGDIGADQHDSGMYRVGKAYAISDIIDGKYFYPRGEYQPHPSMTRPDIPPGRQ